MRHIRLPSIAAVCLLAGVWGGASCLLNPHPVPPGVQPEPPYGTGSPTGGSTGTGGPGAGGAGGSGIVTDAATPPRDASSGHDAARSDGSADGSTTTTDAPDKGSDGGETGSTETGSEADASLGEASDASVGGGD